MAKFFLVAGSLLAAVAVVAGAFGAHTLTGRVTPERLQVFETAARYQMYHALALLITGWAAINWPGWHTTAAGLLFLAGILVFSGSLYTLVLTDTGWWGAITPLGGIAFIGGWILLALAFLRSP